MFLRSLNRLAVLFATLLAPAVAQANTELPTRVRRPVALIPRGDQVLVGNRHSGTISVIDADSGRVTAEHAVSKRIADLAILGNHVLVLDDRAQELRKVTFEGSRVSVSKLAEVPLGAAKLAVSSTRRQVFVSGTWSRTVVALTLDEAGEQVIHSREIAIPFAPRELLLVGDERTLLAADAFGGRLAIVDAAEEKLRSVRRFAGHNIRGLAVNHDGSELHVAHQKLAPLARADYDDLHWGQLIANTVQVFDLAEVLDGDETLNGWLDSQGGVGSGAGDPGGVVTGSHRLVAIALSGVGEVSVRRGNYAARIPVESGPAALAVHRDRLYVANRLSDSVSIIDVPHGKLLRTVSLGPAPEPSAIERGEKLFFDARLSHDGWMSCHSCHTDGHSSGLLVDTLGDGDYGAPKRVPSLLGTRGTGPWSWTGRMATLADQVRKSVETTMHGQPLTDRQTTDLVAYLESLDPPPAPSRARPGLLAAGRKVFQARGCVDCHTGHAFTRRGTFDVGLADERRRTRFNPPSLRGVRHRDGLFHDARAARLEDVFTTVGHQLERPLSAEELAALLAYLRSL